MQAPNEAPEVSSNIGNQSFNRNEFFEFDISGAFRDSDSADPLTFTIANSQGGVLPNWISVNPLTGIVHGMSTQAGSHSIEAYAYDEHGEFTSQEFVVTIQAASAPTLGSDLVVTVDDVPPEVAAGDPFSLRLQVQNNGPSSAENVIVTHDLPSGTNVVELSSGCAVTGENIACNLDTIDAQQTKDLQLTLSTESIGSFEVTALAESSLIDPNVTNNHDSVQTLIVGPPTELVALDDRAIISENATVAAFGNVLENDRGDALTVQGFGNGLSPGVVQGDFGILTWDRQGGYAYVVSATDTAVNSLSPGQVLGDVFEYSVKDARNTSRQAMLNVTIVGMNDAPILSSSIPNQTFGQHEDFSISIAEHFQEVDSSDRLTFSASLADGGLLPEWVAIDPQTGVFNRTSLGSLPETSPISILVSATDLSNKTVSDDFDLLPIGPDLVYQGVGDLRLSLDSTGNTIQIFTGEQLVLERPRNATEQIEVYGAPGSSDSLTIDFGNGNPIPSDGLDWNGRDGNGIDELVLIDGAVDSMAIDVANQIGVGAIGLSVGSQTSTIRFTDIGPIQALIDIDDAIVNLSDSADQLNLFNPVANQVGIDGNHLHPMTVQTPTGSLEIQGNQGFDTVQTSRSLTVGGTDLKFDVDLVHFASSVTTNGGSIRSAGWIFATKDTATIKTGGGSIDLGSKYVMIGEAVFTGGGDFVSHGNGSFFTVDSGSNLNTRGGNRSGNVIIDHRGNVNLQSITTAGGDIDVHAGGDTKYLGRIDTRSRDAGDVRSTGDGDLIAASPLATIVTSGSSSDGVVSLTHQGSISLHSVVTGGGSIELAASEQVQLNGRVSTRGGPTGTITSSGQEFVSIDGASISSGGDIHFDHAGPVQVGEVVATNGNDFVSIGNSSFTTMDAGASIRTRGGSVSLDHVGLVQMKGSLATSGGPLHLTIHPKAGSTEPLVSFGRRLVLYVGSTITVDMRSDSVANFTTGSSAVLANAIAFPSIWGPLPKVIDVVNESPSDGPLEVTLTRSLVPGHGLDLRIAAVDAAFASL